MESRNQFSKMTLWKYG